MKKVLLFILFLYCQSIFSQQTTTIYMIRHAEKDSTETNPQLSEKGVQRALQWANYFSQIPIDFFYTTLTQRTQQTCASIAASKQKGITFYEIKGFNLKNVIEKHKGKTILIVGHSNTIPDQINDLLKKEKYNKIEENEFGNLYKITVNGDLILNELLHPLK